MIFGCVDMEIETKWDDNDIPLCFLVSFFLILYFYAVDLCSCLEVVCLISIRSRW